MQIKIYWNKYFSFFSFSFFKFGFFKSRIVHQAKNERNYHVFYYLCKGSNEQEKKLWYLTKAENFHYLNQVKQIYKMDSFSHIFFFFSGKLF